MAYYELRQARWKDESIPWFFTRTPYAHYGKKIDQMFNVGGEKPSEFAKKHGIKPSSAGCYKPIDIFKKALEIGVPVMNGTEAQRVESIAVALSESGLDLLDESAITEGAISLASVCGVYFLIHRSQIVYVGQSVNVMARISHHRQDSSKEFDSFSFIVVDRCLLDRVEAAYIHRFRPKLNRSYPSLR